jgi:flagellar biosynthesis/type III secretory pathway chaperone
MGNGLLIKNLNEILDKELVVYRKIFNVINSEYDSIVSLKYDEIHKHLSLKNNLFQEISSLELQRTSILEDFARELRVDKIDSLSQLIDYFDNKDYIELLSAKRTSLRLIIQHIQDASQRNTNFINHSISNFNSVFQNFKDIIDDEGRRIGRKKNVETYGKDGKKTKLSIDNKRSLSRDV